MRPHAPGHTGVEATDRALGAPPPGAADGGGPVIDSHVHFWDPRRLVYPWLAEAPPLNRPFTADDFAAAVPEPVEAVFVEAGRADDQAGQELEWVRAMARTRPWIRGAVVHVSLADIRSAASRVARHAGDPFVVGVRRNAQDEPPGYVSGPELRAGVRLLGEAGLPFDACVREHQLPELAELAEACPRTVIVLDHLGKPVPGRPGSSWRQAVARLARSGNVVCKLSGLATEAAPGTEPAVLVALLREALETFGPDRCLYGGDWPVMTLATRYATWLELVRAALAGFPADAADAVLRATAIRTYRLDRALPPGRHRTREEPA
ncbi:amidohydrolase family protein [Streptomyces sp. NBC_01190]|uniref:amidohydrolase family protein n=1 Tax=Streptomyces sp. NBC_01190 TaxID=2903767 RepID=UPI00386695BE|nr:amidohydrolase family protein [Streptomyces sp. NBC_01190]